MDAAHYDLEIEQGETYEKTFAWATSDGTTSTPVNLTGWSAEVRFVQTTPDVSIDVSTTAGGVVIDPLAGTVTVTLSPAQTVLLTKTASYDVAMTAPSGARGYLVYGKAKLKKRVTLP